MKGILQYKTQCGKFKRIWDGIKTDIINDAGYTWHFYFYNKPVSKKLIDKELSPMHVRLLHMFANFKDKNHTVNMDNLFNSVLFTIDAQDCKTKVKT